MTRLCLVEKAQAVALVQPVHAVVSFSLSSEVAHFLSKHTKKGHFESCSELWKTLMKGTAGVVHLHEIICAFAFSCIQTTTCTFLHMRFTLPSVHKLHKLYFRILKVGGSVIFLSFFSFTGSPETNNYVYMQPNEVLFDVCAYHKSADHIQ